MIPRDRHKQRGSRGIVPFGKGKCLLLQMHVWQVTGVAVCRGNVKGGHVIWCAFHLKGTLLFLFSIALSCFRHLLLLRWLIHVTFTGVFTHGERLLNYNSLFYFGKIFICKAGTSCTLHTTQLKWTTDWKHRQRNVFISEELFVKCKKTKRKRRF